MVLLVADGEAEHEAAAEGLRDHGHQVVDVGSASHAIRLVRKGLRPDLLVMEQGMPGEAPAIERGRALPHLPVLAILGGARGKAGRDAPLPEPANAVLRAGLAERVAAILSRKGNVLRFPAQ